MANSLIIRKRADKSGQTPPEGEAWPLAHVELVSEPPAKWFFSPDFVNSGVREGWITFEGSPIAYAAHPDPGGPAASVGEQTLRTPGDTIVLHLKAANGDDQTIRYRITDPPVPPYWRVHDSADPTGVRASHVYTVELIS